MGLGRFAKFSWGVLVFNLLVILWGAYVRASGSGAGCGNHWPLCNGEVLPRSDQIETLIEFTHRITSGVAFVLVAGLLVWALRAYPKGNLVRTGAWLAMFFITTEALIGAGLVIFEWVADNVSIGRAISIAIHLANTFLLLASITLTAWWASGGKQLRTPGHRGVTWALGLGLLGVLSLGVTGAITALGDTLFPSTSLAQGLQQDFSASAHFLIRLRIWHPLIAISVGFYLVLVAGVLGLSRSDRAVKRFALAIVILFVIQFGVGIINILLLAPVSVQLVHLLLADLIWIALVLLAAATLADVEVSAETLESKRSVRYAETQSASSYR